MKPSSRTLAHSGRLSLGLIIFLALLGTAVYLGFQLIPHWIHAYDLKNFMSEKARTGEVATDDFIRQVIIRHAAEMGIELSESDITIDRTPSEIAIAARWQINFNFLGLYARTFIFSPEIHVNYR